MEVTQESVERKLEPRIYVLFHFGLGFTLTSEALSLLIRSERVWLHAVVPLCDPLVSQCLVREDLIANIRQ